MKIAVLLYGHLRDFDRCATSLREHLLDKYNCDVFIHTWDVTEHSTTSWHSQRFQPISIDENTVDRVKVLYNPKGLIVEHQEPYKDEQVIEPYGYRSFSFSTASCYYLFYTMSKANELRRVYEKKEGFKYDLIIVTRPDVKLKNDFDIDKVLNQTEMLGLDLNKCRFFASHTTSSEQPNAFMLNSPNDLFFLGVPECIDKYIAVNKSLSKEYIVNHSPNIVSIYTSKEIDAGIYPVPLSYTLGMDWNFSGYRMRQSVDYQQFKSIRRLFWHIVVFLCKPIFKLYMARPWMNYYNS